MDTRAPRTFRGSLPPASTTRSACSERTATARNGCCACSIRTPNPSRSMAPASPYRSRAYIPTGFSNGAARRHPPCPTRCESRCRAAPSACTTPMRFRRNRRPTICFCSTRGRTIRPTGCSARTCRRGGTSPVCAFACGRRMPSAFPWSAISTAGTGACIKWRRSARAACGNCSCPDSPPARSTSSRSATATAAPCWSRPTPTRKASSCARRPRRA